MMFLSKRAKLEIEKIAIEGNYIDKRVEESGNITYIYDKKHIKKRTKKKEKKIQRLAKSISDIRKKVKEEIKSDDIKTKMAALAVGLIDETYERIGNRESATIDHYGVTTWKVKHIKFSGNKAIIKYVGKSGVKQNKEVKQKHLVSVLKELTKDKKKGSNVFEKDGIVLTANNVNSFLSRFKITAKDIRGYHANTEMSKALKTVRKGKLPKEEKEKIKQLKEEFKEALEITAKKVGHEPSTLKNQYLVPSIEENYIGIKKAYQISKRDFIKDAQELALKQPGVQIIIEPFDPAVDKALKSLPHDLSKNITKVVVHQEGGPGQLGHVEMGPGKDPREIHIFKNRIVEQVKKMFGTEAPTPKQLEEATLKAITETLVHEGVHIGPEKTQEQILSPEGRFRDEISTQLETKRHLSRVPGLAMKSSLELDTIREKFFPSFPMTEPNLEFAIYSSLNKKYNMVKTGIELLKDPNIYPMMLEISNAISFNKKAIENRSVSKHLGVINSMCITEDDVLKLAYWQVENQLQPTGKLDRQTIEKFGKLLTHTLPMNFGVVLPGKLYRGSIISDINQLKSLRDNFGVERVISLHSHPETPKMCEEIGIEHLSIPLEYGKPEEEGRKILGNFVSKLLLEKPTYIHCWYGMDRTGGVIARLRTENGWSNKDAYLEAKSFGFKDLFADFIDWFCECGQGEKPVDTNKMRKILNEGLEQDALTPVPNDQSPLNLGDIPHYTTLSDTMHQINPYLSITPPVTVK